MGRPRLADVARHPHGGTVRRTPLEVRDDALSIAREARQRHWGTPVDEVRHEEWGTVLGRLCKLGKDGGGITREQYEAGRLYAEMRADYDRVMRAPAVPPASWARWVKTEGEENPRRSPTKPPPEPDLDGTSRDYREWCDHVKDEHRRCVLALMATMDLHATAAIERVAVEDRPLTWNLIGSLRLALNAVGKVLR